MVILALRARTRRLGADRRTAEYLSDSRVVILVAISPQPLRAGRGRRKIQGLYQGKVDIPQRRRCRETIQGATEMYANNVFMTYDVWSVLMFDPFCSGHVANHWVR